MRFLLLLAIALLPHPYGSAAEHPFHATVAEMDWNPAADCLEIALCMPAAVVEDELSRLQGKRVSLDRSADAESLLQHYIGSKMGISTQTRQWSLKWVGAELEEAEVWSYFELRPQPQDGASVSSSLAVGADPEHTWITCRLLENRPGQVNLMTLSAGGKNSLLHFSENHVRTTLSFLPQQSTAAAPILTD
jgi:hypothetical protein